MELLGIATGMKEYISWAVAGGSQARARRGEIVTWCHTITDWSINAISEHKYADSWYILIDQYGVRSARVASRRTKYKVEI